MKKYAILTFMAKGISSGTAPEETHGARLNEGKTNSLQRRRDGSADDLIRNDDGTVKQFISQVDALNFCVSLGWNLEQTIFESGYGFNSRDPLSTFIFILSKIES